MDLVYILSSEDHSNNIELQYSIRSFFKHLKGFERVFFVGGTASYLQREFHIPYEDKHPRNKARNIYEKICAACLDERVSDKFICSSDDIYLLTDFDADTFPYFFCGTLEETLQKIDSSGAYYPYVKATLDILQENNLPTINFNGHTPIVYDKKIYLETVTSFDWSKPKGYISKSLYCNALGIKGEFQKDRKFHWPYTESAIRRKIEDKKIFSTENIAVNQEMIAVMNDLYPKSYWF